MIPYKLHLRNFLSYREPPDALDFSGMNLVCVSGANGHGKSSLIDAVTWALWGKARASDDELMHSGSTEMEVRFEFILGGDRYQVLRRRYGTGKTKKSLLEVAVLNEETGAWQSLSEPSLRATQRRIEQILRMNYETFSNSALLRQGEADAFSSKTPGKRKEILANILNLAEFDALAERAKVRAKAAEADVKRYQMRLDELDAELGQRAQLENDLQAQKVLETQSRLARSQADQAVLQLQVAVSQLEGKQTLQTTLQKSVQENQQALAGVQQQLQKKQQQSEEQQALLARRQAIEQTYEQLQTARQQEQRWQNLAEQHQKINERLRQVEKQLAVTRTSMENELAHLQKELEEARVLINSAKTLEPKAQEVRQEIAELEALVEQQQTGLAEQAALQAAIETLAARQQETIAEGKRLKERLQVLLAESGSVCPVCKQPLGDSGREHLQAEYETQIEALRAEARAHQQKEKEQRAAQKALAQRIAHIRRKVAQLPALRKQLAQIEARLQESQEMAEKLPVLQERIAGLQDKLQGIFAPDLQAQQDALHQELATVGYDAAAHQQTRALLRQLQGVEAEYARLQQAVQQQALLAEEIGNLEAQSARLLARMAEDKQKLAALDEELASLPTLQADLRRKQEEAAAAHERWEKANAELVRLQQRLAALDVIQERRKEVGRQWAAAKQQAARYRQLQAAFGPRGVQAMIIENALPELEAEANRLLRKLTDGRMNVQIATTRQLKSGGVAETLDIIISDELGTRPYELYSGGEAFRIDLALRIALSRLLARRAGAALQSLFIDEGFGSQDARGRENLVDALHMIKDEFALILVITHIEELKELFPVRIHVVKEDGSGSYFVVE